MKKISIRPEALPYALACLVFGIITSFFWGPSALIFLVLLCFILFFFRDPQRYTPTDKCLIVSPADGKILSIEHLDFHPVIQAAAIKVTIFLSLFDVHINRSPVNGTLKQAIYSRGKRFPANWKRAGSKNEKNDLIIESRDFTLLVTQIAGILGRRIVQWIDVGSPLAVGQKIGMIKFSSRTEIVFPAGLNVLVKKGQKVKGGETVFCDIR
ncbi:MAG: phosphatidylserine decarboxylase [Candidatus Altiarchaeota archaeon]